MDEPEAHPSIEVCMLVEWLRRYVVPKILTKLLRELRTADESPPAPLPPHVTTVPSSLSAAKAVYELWIEVTPLERLELTSIVSPSLFTRCWDPP